MSNNKKAKPIPPRARPNVADSIDATAKRIAASLGKAPEQEEWDQERIERLKACNGKVGEIPISVIRTNENIRQRIDENGADFKSLVESIRTHGILQPPIVTVVTNENGRSSILLVGGERRLRAAKAAGYHAINCMVRIFDNQSVRLTASMAENINRRDLECLDIGQCFLSLSEQGYRYSDIERLFNRDERTIGRYIKMAKWPDGVKETIRSNPEKFTARYLLALASQKVSDSDLASQVVARVSGTKTDTPEQKMGKRRSLAKRFAAYCHSKNLGRSEQSMIFDALVELGLLARDHESPEVGKRVQGATSARSGESSLSV